VIQVQQLDDEPPEEAGDGVDEDRGARGEFSKPTAGENIT
jgi:hypothetical protein